MATREEIREGIVREVIIILKGGDTICPKCYADSILSLLHSQGVKLLNGESLIGKDAEG